MVKLEGYSNYYVSENGIIFSLKIGKALQPYSAGKGNKREGYLKIKLFRDDGKRIIWYVSRFIYLAHIGEIPEGFEIDHIDGNRSNNSITNLRILTRKQNVKRKKKYKGVS